MMNRIPKECSGGFTLVETLVAITILVTAIVGPLYAVHKSLVASYTARDSLTAVALAQEGIEYVRGVRDSNYLAHQSNWLNNLSQCQAAAGCEIDPSATTIAAQIQDFATSTATLRLDASYRYRLGSGTATRFIRKVKITTISATEVDVATTVSWVTLKIPYSITVSEHLHNWQ